MAPCPLLDRWERKGGGGGGGGSQVWREGIHQMPPLIGIDKNRWLSLGLPNTLKPNSADARILLMKVTNCVATCLVLAMHHTGRNHSCRPYDYLA